MLVYTARVDDRDRASRGPSATGETCFSRIGLLAIIDREFGAYRFKIRKNSRILPFSKFVKIRQNSFLRIIMNAVLNFDFASFKFAFCI